MWRPTTLARLATGVSAIVVVAVLGLIPPSPFCIPVVVAASQEKFALVALLSDEYERGRPDVNGRCVDVRVYRVASGEAEAALRRGWDEISDGAPAPDVWSPAATTWVTLLDFHRTADGLPKIVPATPPRIIQSPLVIAMPKRILVGPLPPIDLHQDQHQSVAIPPEILALATAIAEALAVPMRVVETVIPEPRSD